jgi:hypothetical protein
MKTITLAGILAVNHTASPAYNAISLPFVVLKLYCDVFVRELLHNELSTAGVIQR